ncbi:MAG: glycosyltransferase family 4 protein, partial [Acidobacteria bacterium]|nr:glycosyltransferase family 4 protein [Acidobacteriota bacterium]
MQRLAWFSPVTPDRSAIARHSADLLPALARGRTIDVYAPAPAADHQPGAAVVMDPGDFDRRQRDAPYDLIVYQLGAAAVVDDVWPFLLRYPGLVVLHEDNFHAARARMLLAEGRGDAYRAELAYNHPGVPAAVGSLGVSGLLGGLERLWPMRRIVLDAARAVLVHNAWLAARIREEAPAVPVYSVEPGVPDVRGAAAGGAAVRKRYGVPEDAVVFAAAGALTPARRLSRALRALAAMPAGTPGWHLLGCVAAYDAAALLAET